MPEEYREKIAKLREFGLGEKEKTTFEEVVEFLESHDGKIMKSNFYDRIGKTLKREQMTNDQIYEVNLYQRWIRASEKGILEKYAGQPIENVPEEYREKIAKLREFGLGITKSKLSQAKQQRDDAKTENDQVKELEQQVAKALKKRGKNYEEQ